MRNAAKFQEFVFNLIGKHNATTKDVSDFNIGEPHTALLIQNPTGGIAPLQILNISKNIIYVHQPLESDGASDPGVTFFTGNGVWVPIGIMQLLPGYYRCYCTITQDYERLVRYARAQQADLASFCNGFWVSALREQGFGKLNASTIKAEKQVVIQGEPEAYVEYENE